MDISLGLLVFLLCFSVFVHVVFGVKTDGKLLLALSRQWTIVPTAIRLSWNESDSTPCSWHGALCNKYGSVVGLNISGLGFAGRLGDEIGYFQHLRTLDVSNNSFVGSGGIPPGLGNCSSLRKFYAISCHLDGTIPSTLSSLSRLVALYLSNNHLLGMIFSIFENNSSVGNTSLGLGGCDELDSLILSYNHFGGGILPGLENCSSLREFAALKCRLFLNDTILQFPLK